MNENFDRRGENYGKYDIDFNIREWTDKFKNSFKIAEKFLNHLSQNAKYLKSLYGSIVETKNCYDMIKDDLKLDNLLGKTRNK